ncbi:nitric oxide reductase transcriptional regulator NorR [Stenotrophomonas sp.]|uniref:nitric oxide reductase transcriptional regulator NorR n=1 Tax=Stenotrophomonas sp. TaxID=69392 RepID=UPI0028B18F9C|nr:nitric oxide reductase transcriptional regulator NorR [Stenotrophomonas sp.]
MKWNDVELTTIARVLQAITPLIANLAADTPADRRYHRLLDTLLELMPCDAVALLRLEGEVLIPLAARGLGADVLGRHFQVAAQPRLKAILDAPGAVLFAPDCGLPDPYDGLLDVGPGHVHDCLGCTLQVGGQPWGVLTLDAADVGRFQPIHLEIIQTLASLAAATVASTLRMDDLRARVADERRVADRYRAALQPAQGVPSMIGQSSAFRQLDAEIALVAPSGLGVLISGETGVGKERVARQIHAQSPRSEQPLVIVSCAALPEALVESELFGHVRGAFTGASGDRPGKFEAANGGTLFLDEIGELPLVAQAKLLRVLQDGQLQRVGSDRDHHADVRLVAATNRDLAAEVKAGRFRADLFHRLGVFPLRVPPLRERGQDVLLLAGHFAEDIRRRSRLRALRLSADARAALLAHDWPGNVRELEYVMARAALKASARHHGMADVVMSVEARDLDLPVANPSAAGDTGTASPAIAGPAAPPSLRAAVDAFQRERIVAALEANAGNLAAAARQLGLDRANLTRLAHRLGVETSRRRG